MKNAINLKAIIWFLLIAFVPTVLLSVAMSLLSVIFSSPVNIESRYMLMVAMFFPMIAALITQKLILKRNIKDLGFKLGSKRMYLYTYFSILIVFIIIYALNWLFISAPDLQLSGFTKQFDLKLPMTANKMILIISLMMLFVAPIVNIIPSFGEELGWRGFLLQELLPLGKTKALIISGIIWGLWHLPFVLFIGFGYGEKSLLGAPIFVLLITALGIWFGYLKLKSGSVWLASFAHAVFNAHSYGVWVILWAGFNPIIAGHAGLIALPVYIVIAIIFLNKTRELSLEKEIHSNQDIE